MKRILSVAVLHVGLFAGCVVESPRGADDRPPSEELENTMASAAVLEREACSCEVQCECRDLEDTEVRDRCWRSCFACIRECQSRPPEYLPNSLTSNQHQRPQRYPRQ